MNTIVVYESQTGFTARYAQWIAQELKCKCVPLKEASKMSLNTYEQVIFGGWIMGNMIFGLNKLLKMISNPTAVFAVGSTPAYEEVLQVIKEQNKLNEIPFFYMEGGFCFDKLGLPQRMILKALKKSTSKKQNRNRQEEFMAQVLGTSFDASKKEQIQALVKYVCQEV